MLRKGSSHCSMIGRSPMAQVCAPGLLDVYRGQIMVSNLQLLTSLHSGRREFAQWLLQSKQSRPIRIAGAALPQRGDEAACAKKRGKRWERRAAFIISSSRPHAQDAPCGSRCYHQHRCIILESELQRHDRVLVHDSHFNTDAYHNVQHPQAISDPRCNTREPSIPHPYPICYRIRRKGRP